ncbi:TetR/AcrR family transcriptional regulator [Jeotgalibaca caeni]|uniref:TetR/AcrR family transcriptional regulator n=1 Tax=Jeotgalibaca caeni TaxID=3028623 RepID=UPI00237D72FF|nr:TetR/AcrR family transcriptional regulator [Jeotgalibaca caeni]MDE1548701.1 TetR/AcrR family transcriptional regulator [Jeotgalibaca caeni]
MSKEKKFKTRNRNIIETAERLIKQKGYHHFKMSDISDELEIAKGTLYNHFSSKEDLLFIITFPKLQKLRDSLSEIVTEDTDFIEKFKKVIQKSMESDYHQFLLLSFSDVAVLFQEKNQKDMERIQNDIIQEFSNVLILGVNEGLIKEDFSLDFLSHQILSALDPLLYSLLVTDSKKMKHEEFINQTTELFLYGIRKGYKL